VEPLPANRTALSSRTSEEGEVRLAGPPSEEVISTLVRAVQDLSLAQSVTEVHTVVRTAARRLTGADGATFVLREGEECFYVDEDAIAPLWKGMRFPLEACISGWSMLHRSHTVIEDIYADARIPADAYRPTFVKSLVMMPIRTLDPIGAIGLYWATHHRASEQEIGLARALADSTAVALESVQRAERLELANRLAETDSLTGLANRRGWERALQHELRPRTGAVRVLLIDLDDFKHYNDTYGHLAGDELLRASGDAWLDALRETDILARLGGDEFGVILADCTLEQTRAIADRLRASVPESRTASIGVATWDIGESRDTLLVRADRALYEAKSAGRNRVVVGS
jgi:diguanylate cyclase (GGDEF)-like protein